MGCVRIKGTIKANNISPQIVLNHVPFVNNLKNNEETQPKIANSQITKFVHTKTLNKQKTINNVENIINEAVKKKKIIKINDKDKDEKEINSDNKSDRYGDIIVIEEENFMEEDKLIIQKAMSNHFLFKDLSKNIINKIQNQLISLKINKDDVLFNDEEEGKFFYIVKSGQLELKIKNVNETKIFKAGDSFGELSLLQRNKRSGIVRCIEDSELFCIYGTIFREIVTKLNKVDLNERFYLISHIPIFRGLNSVELHNIAKGLIKCEYSKGHCIISEGDKGESLFVIKRGTVSCIKNNKEFRKLQSKEYFGQNSILFDTKRSLTIISHTDTECFQISRNELSEILGDNYKNVLLMGISRESFKNSKYMKYFLIDEFFFKIFPLFAICFYKKSNVVIPSDHFEKRKIVVLVEGTLINSQNGEKLCNRGQVYGDGLIGNTYKLKYDIISMNESITLEANWEEILSALNLNLEESEIFAFSERLNQMKSNKLFQNISNKRLFDICKSMKKETYKSGDLIIKDGGDKCYLYLLVKGQVHVYKNKKFLRELQEGACFGEVSLLLNELQSADVMAMSDVTTFKLSKDDFLKYIDENIYNFLVYQICLQDNLINLEDLYFIKELGKGKFGTVSLVHNTKNAYAIKAVSKSAADKQKLLIKYFQKERQVLLSIDHPFIVKLVKTMKNDEYIFYLMENINGIVMRNIFDNRPVAKCRDKYETQFYCALILISLNYLNIKKIVHRDIKPDNIMIDHKGYLKIIDFGTASVINDYTTTITGTPHYIAPEILLGKGYSLEVDYWSLGIMAFEITFNYFPFGHKLRDPMDIYRDIINKQLTFPNDFRDNSTIGFIKSLLKKKAHDRVCKFDVLKKFEFFENLNWAPFIPKNLTSIENHFSNAKIKYLDKLDPKSISANDSILSSNHDNIDEYYDPNWADEF